MAIDPLAFAGLNFQLNMPNGDTVLRGLVDPTKILDLLLGPQQGGDPQQTLQQILSAVQSRPAVPGGAPVASDSVHVVDAVQYVASVTFTIAQADTDYPIPMPGGAKSAVIIAFPNNTPANGIQAYFSTSNPWPPANPNGFAYDISKSNPGAGVGGYTGHHMRADEEYGIDLHRKAGILHVASPVAGTEILLSLSA